MFIEPLESRIAPASLTFVSDRLVKWTDADGDSVTLTISTGTLEDGNFTYSNKGAGLVVQKLDLSAAEFSGASISIVASREAAGGRLVGSGLVDFGYIDATGNALGKVSIDGDLGRIDAGPAVLTAQKSTAIASLQAFTVGVRTDLLGAVLPGSEINGKIGSLTVFGDVRGSFHLSGGAFGSIDKLNIGALVGGDLAESGRIDVTGSIKSLIIRGDVQGGAGQHSGSVEAGIAIGKARISGSVIGGQSGDPTTDGTGIIRAGSTIGSIAIKGSIFGGNQQESGLIDAGGAIGSVSITGSIYGGSAGQDNGGLRAGTLGKVVIVGDVRGGSAEHSGFVKTTSVGALSLRNLLGGTADESGLLDLGDVKALNLTGDLVGGDLGGAATADLVHSGAVLADAIAKLTVTGSIRAGQDSSATFDLVSSAAIRVDNTLGSIAVKGGLIGNESARVLITARGAAVVQPSADVAIGSASFGSVSYADILAGYNAADHLALAAVNPNAQIGKVVVGGNWTASNLVAGAKYATVFADGTDVKSTGADNTNIASRIGSIAIKGRIFGTDDAGDHFGFVAQGIGAFKLGTKGKIALNAGNSNDSDSQDNRYLLANTLDVRIFELAT